MDRISGLLTQLSPANEGIKEWLIKGSEKGILSGWIMKKCGHKTQKEVEAERKAKMAKREEDLKHKYPPEIRKQWVSKASVAVMKCYKSFPSHIQAAVTLNINGDRFISGETDFFTVGHCQVENAYKAMKDKYADYEDFYDRYWANDEEFDNACIKLAEAAIAAIPKGSSFLTIDNLSGWDIRDYVVAIK